MQVIWRRFILYVLISILQCGMELIETLIFDTGYNGVSEPIVGGAPGVSESFSNDDYCTWN